MTNVAYMDPSQKEMEESSPALEVYNAADEFVEAMYDNVKYWLNPHGRAVDPRNGQEVSADGISHIRDRWIYEYIKSDGQGRKRSDSRVLKNPASQIVKHIEKVYGARGVVWLRGSKEKQETERRKARESFLKWKHAQMANLVEGWNNYVTAFHANPGNRGQTPNMPPENVVKAMEWLDDYRLGNVARLQYSCNHEGYQTDDRDKFDRHMRARHPEEYQGWLDKENGTETPKVDGRTVEGRKRKAAEAVA